MIHRLFHRRSDFSMILRTALLAMLMLVAGSSLAQTEDVIESLSVKQLKTFMSDEGYAVNVDDDVR